MAANEHKNLTDINRHNPKGFESAINNTVCSKSIGTSATGTDGNLIWQDKSLMGVSNYKMQGYTAAATSNYQYGSLISNNLSPFLISIDAGNTAVSSITIVPSRFSAIGLGCVVPENATVTSIKGWASSTGSVDFTIAICKITPVAGASAAVATTVIKEITKTGLGSLDELISVDETTFAAAIDAEISAGDIIFPMIRQVVESGDEIQFNLTIRTTTF